MSELLASAAQALKAPESIVQRSAEARAKATGASVDDVLSAWAGGGSVAQTAPTPSPSGSAGDGASSETAPVPATPAPEPVAEPAPVAAPVAVAVMEPFVAEPDVEPAPLGDRVRRGWRIGLWAGLALSLLVMVFSVQWLLPRASLAGTEGDLRSVIDVIPGWLIVGAGLLGLASGMALAGFGRGAVALRSPGHVLANPWGSSVALGAVGGAVVGLLTGAIVAGSGEAVEAQEGLVAVPALGAFVWAGLGWMLLGGVAGVLVQLFGTPVGISDADQAEVVAVRRRLGAAFGFPIRVALTILVIVLPIAYSFISFPKWAPLTGTFVAASILAFAGLSSLRPNLRISRGEFFVAAAGVVTVVVIIISVLAAQGAGHGGDETHSDTATEQSPG